MQSDLDQLKSLEEELFKQTVRGDPAAVAALLADDFIEFGRSGSVYDKDVVVQSLSDEVADASKTLAARDFAIRRLADDVFLLTYLSFRVSAGAEKRHTLRSSIWKRVDDRWQMVFHQGTPTER